MKVVINNCFGGFSLSEEGMRAYFARKGKEVYTEGSSILVSYFDAPRPLEFKIPKHKHFMDRDNPEYENHTRWYSAHYLSNSDMPRDDKDLISVVEELGERANGRFASLLVVDIPDDADWEIAEYDGSEHVAEKHRTWP